MIDYGIEIIPLINNLKRQLPDITQPWYADNSGALGTLSIIETYFNSLTHQGPGHVYHNRQSKTVLIVHLENLEAGKKFSTRHGFKVCTGARYLGGYIGDNNFKSDWMRERTQTREKNIVTIRKTTGKYPQDIYSAAAHAIQSEWIFLQRVTWDTGDTFFGVENMLQGFFATSFLRK